LFNFGKKIGGQEYTARLKNRVEFYLHCTELFGLRGTNSLKDQNKTWLGGGLVGRLLKDEEGRP
jgi:hypothetical protein